MTETISSPSGPARPERGHSGDREDAAVYGGQGVDGHAERDAIHHHRSPDLPPGAEQVVASYGRARNKDVPEHAKGKQRQSE